MFLGAFNIVYQEQRGWNAGVGGLAFLGLAVGEIVGLAYTITDNTRYQRLGRQATPESRLPPAMVGAFALPIGMFSFAWTNGANIQYVPPYSLCHYSRMKLLTPETIVGLPASSCQLLSDSAPYASSCHV